MNFKLWFNEATMRFDDIASAIKKTLEFVVTDGTWQFEPKTYGLSGTKAISVAGHFFCDKGHFFITAHAVYNHPIDTYDTNTGQIDANSKIEMIASVCLIGEKNAWGGVKLKKIAERSETNGGRLNTPYHLAQWVKSVIDNYGKPDDGDDPESSPSPVPSGSRKLVGV